MSAPAAPVTAAEADVNSLAFWDARFARSWQVDHGPEQTRFFGELALATLSREHAGVDIRPRQHDDHGLACEFRREGA